SKILIAETRVVSSMWSISSGRTFFPRDASEIHHQIPPPPRRTTIPNVIHCLIRGHIFFFCKTATHRKSKRLSPSVSTDSPIVSELYSPLPCACPTSAKVPFLPVAEESLPSPSYIPPHC